MSYQNSVIYKIECNDINIKECYIGSTRDFVLRRYNHKHDCNTSHRIQYNYKVYQFIRDNGGWKNWSMKSIINYPCNSKKELFIKEQEVILSFDNTLNCIKPYLSNLEKKQQRIKCDKEYRIKHNERIKKYKSEKIQCECGRWSVRSSMARHRKSNFHTDFLKNK